MSGDKLMLQGRYFSQLRKLGLVGMGATVITGAACYYGLYVRRGKVFDEYEKTLTPENMKKLDDRMMRFGGYKKNEKYPTIPFKSNKDGSMDELIEKFTPEAKLISLESRILNSYDPAAHDAYVKLYLDDFRGDWFDSEAEKQAAEQKLAGVRGKIVNSCKKKYPKVASFLDRNADRLTEKHEEFKEITAGLKPEEKFLVLYYTQIYMLKKKNPDGLRRPLHVGLKEQSD